MHNFSVMSNIADNHEDSIFVMSSDSTSGSGSTVSQEKLELHNDTNMCEYSNEYSHPSVDPKDEFKLSRKSKSMKNKGNSNIEEKERIHEESRLTQFGVPFLYPIKWKESPWKLSSWIALSLTLDGRDKITKVIQYSSRLLGWYYNSKQWRILQTKLTEARKSYRLGRTLIEIHKLKKYLQNQSLKLDYSTQSKKTEQSLSTIEVTSAATSNIRNFFSLISPIIKHLGLAGFWTADNISYLLKIGFFGNQYKELYSNRVSKLATRSYFIGAIAGLYTNTENFIRSLQENQKGTKHDLCMIHELNDNTKEFAVLKESLELKKMKHMNCFIALCKV